MEEAIIPLPPGESAPPFTLPNILSDQPLELTDHLGQIIVLVFWSTECPWCQHYDDYFTAQAAEWDGDVRLILIDSNTDENQDDVRDKAAGLGYLGPILDDPDHAVADAYGAVTTPHIYVLDRAGVIAYQGAVDDRSFRQREATVNYLEAAVGALLSDNHPDPAETPAYGCTIVRSADN